MWELIWPALVIAMLRASDVTLNVFKTVAIVQGRPVAAPLLQGAESGMWLAAAGIVFADMTPARAVGFVIGVMLGTVIGMHVVTRLRLGMVTVRIYRAAPATSAGSRDRRQALGPPEVDADPTATATLDMALSVARELHHAGYPATTFEGWGHDGPVEMTLVTVKRREAPIVMELARRVAPTAFISVDNDLHPATEQPGQSPGVRA